MKLRKMHCIFLLKTVTSKYKLKTSTSIIETMVFKGRDLVRSKVVINNKIIEQIHTFNYVGCSLSYGNEKVCC
jgi:hypothetical protein